MDHLNTKRTVLIVKEDTFSASLLAASLSAKGFIVITNDDNLPVNSFESAISVIQRQTVHIIITGIKLAGEADGIQLGAWVKNNCDALVMIWSVNADLENLERARHHNIHHFIAQSVNIDTDISQVWYSLFLMLPLLGLATAHKTLGNYLYVKEVDNAAELPIWEKRAPGSVYQERYIKWAEVSHIVSYNTAKTGEGNNNVLIYYSSSHGFIYRAALADLLTRLPESFVRFNKETIINLHHITAKGRGFDLFYIGNLQFKLNDNYRAQALAKLQALLYKQF